MDECDDLISRAESYLKFRRISTENQLKLEMVLSAKLPKIRGIKANAGYDMSILMLLEDGFLDAEQTLECRGYYNEWKKAESAYRGMEKILEATRTKISFAQSYMKYTEEHT